MVVQEIILQAPDLVRRLIVDGAGPRGGQGMELIAQLHGGSLVPTPTIRPRVVWLAVKFSPPRPGQAAGREFLKRTHLRQVGRDPEVNDKVSPAQVEAIGKWGVQQKVHRLSEDDKAANTRRERQQRREHTHGELFHHAAEHAECRS